MAEFCTSISRSLYPHYKKFVSPSHDDRHMFLWSFCRMDYYSPLGSSQSLYRFLYWANLSSVWAPMGLARFLNVLGFVRSSSFKNKTDNNFIKPNHILSTLLISTVNTTYLLSCYLCFLHTEQVQCWICLKWSFSLIQESQRVLF